jgi:hypothetical protein
MVAVALRWRSACPVEGGGQQHLADVVGVQQAGGDQLAEVERRPVEGVVAAPRWGGTDPRGLLLQRGLGVAPGPTATGAAAGGLGGGGEGGQRSWRWGQQPPQPLGHLGQGGG